jgi:2-isopropylmalate synthase
MNQASGMGEKAIAGHAEWRPAARESRIAGRRPVDATFKAIEGLAKSGAELLLYSVNAVTTGTESQGEVTCACRRAAASSTASGADTDIVVASAKAYISALNKLESKIERLNPQHQL